MVLEFLEMSNTYYVWVYVYDVILRYIVSRDNLTMNAQSTTAFLRLNSKNCKNIIENLEIVGRHEESCLWIRHLIGK